MSARGRVKPTTLLTLLVALALTGCSSTGPSGSGTPSPSVPTSPSPTASPTPSGSLTPCAFAGTTSRKLGTFAGNHQFLLTGLRVSVDRCFDRVTFEMRPQSGSGGRPGFGVRYEKGPFTQDPSDEPIVVQGNAFLVVRFEPVHSADLSKPDAPETYTGPRTLNPSETAHIVQVRESGDFEGQMTWIIGLKKTRPFTARVSSSASRIRLIVDVG